MATDAALTGPMNLGNPEEFTIRQLAEMVIDLTGSVSTLEYRPLPADDPSQRRPDIGLAREKLGWQPETRIKEGLVRIIAYFEDLMHRGLA
jgi:UDP-glucuronate decarboxylase